MIQVEYELNIMQLSEILLAEAYINVGNLRKNKHRTRTVEGRLLLANNICSISMIMTLSFFGLTNDNWLFCIFLTTI
jgi:hypothetical protein